MSLTPQAKQIVITMMTKANITPGSGKTLDALINGATYQGRPLSGDNRRAVRKHLRKLGIQSPVKTKRPGYREFIEWIALNDDESLSTDGGSLVTVMMVAHLFGKTEEKVIADVLASRDKEDAR